MSVLPSGHQLHQVLPDLDDLMADPRAYLTAAPLAFGPRRMYGLAALFGVPGLALLASCYWAGLDPERLCLGAGLCVGALIWLSWTLLMRGHELVLHPDGVEVNYRETSVRAPWSLFNAEGKAFVPDSDSPTSGLTLPVNPAAVPFIELTRDGVVVETGAAVAGPQWHLRNREDVVLPGRYEIAANDVGELLLILGGRLGRDLPSRPAPLDDEPMPDTEIDPTGWFTVSLARLELPPCCARCEGPPDDVLPLVIHAPGDFAFALIKGVRALEVPVPVCLACRDKFMARQRKGMTLGLVIGAAAGALGGLTLAPIGAAAGLCVGSLCGCVVGLWLGRDLPVRARRYSPSRGVVQIRCENAAVAERARRRKGGGR